MREQDFQNACMIALARTNRVRVWRQPTGKLVQKSGAVQAAPVGASDVCGVAIGSGRLLQLEFKGVKTRVSEAQLNWLARVREWGGVALLLRYDAEQSLEENVARAVTLVLAELDK